MKIVQTEIEGAVVVDLVRHSDTRGSFARLFCESELRDILGERRIVQINHSRSTLAGTVRGLHYQRGPHAEMKFVQCLKGRAWDVVVDLRAGSRTFLRWRSEELAGDTSRMIVVPEGCAHGFQTLEANTELLYLHTEFYNRESEAGVAATDPLIGISWPLETTTISEKDAAYPPLPTGFQGIAV